MEAFLLGAALVAYNNILNRSSWFNGAPFVPVNLVAAATLVALALGPLGLDADALGFDLSLTGLAFGALIGCSLAIPLFVLASSPRTARFIADERSAGLAGRRLVYQTIVRVPLGTALLEEVAFRGVLFALVASAGTLPAALFSSVAFGLWHITPSLNMLDANRPGAPHRSKVIFAADTVIFTALAGLGFVALRIETGDLGAPLVLHATLNSLATVAASRAARRRSLELGIDVDHTGKGAQSGNEVLRSNSGGELDHGREGPPFGFVLGDLERLKSTAQILDNTSDVTQSKLAVDDDPVPHRPSAHPQQNNTLKELQSREHYD